jgi:hypothetical protein
MKKLFLLSAAGLLCFGASAQQANQSVVRNGADAPAVIKAAPAGSTKMITPRNMNTAKVTAATIWTENFSSGTTTSLPTGWTATAGTGLGNATWYWTKNAASGSFNIGALNSTTASNGWMIYNSDSIGDLFPTVLPLTGSLISPTINCASNSSVMVTFQQLFRKFRDSTYLDVSNDGGATWGYTFPIKENNDMGNNTTNAKNPTLVRVNITSAAANKANVKLRFRYVINVNSGAGGTFNWLIDDINVTEIDPVELGIDNSAMYLYLGSGGIYTNYSLFSAIPRSLVDSVLPITYITNYGLNSVSSIPLDYKLYNGTTQIHTSSTTFPNVPTNGIDSVIDWTGTRLNATGNYVAAFHIGATGDAFAANDVDTQRFTVTDTTFTTYGSTLSGGYYLHRPASQGELSYQMGARFDIPVGRKDTLTSVSVSFDDGTTTGVNTIVQIYKMTGGPGALNWTPVASCRTKVLSASDISTSSSIVYTNYPINPVGGISNFILDSGYYAAIVKTINAPASSSVVINAATTIIDRYNVAGYFGQADTGDNVAGYSFSPVGIATGLADATPLVRIHFGKYSSGPGPGSVATIQGVTIGDAFPNPANNTVTVPVSVTTNADIKVSLSSVMGQVIATENLGRLSAGQKKSAQFNTSGLAAGVYLYTVEANGSRVSNRVVVAH